MVQSPRQGELVLTAHAGVLLHLPDEWVKGRVASYDLSDNLGLNSSRRAV
jgi:hypothetical protein